MFENIHTHPTGETTPNHVGIIPDGGRRWAKAKGLTLEESYRHTRLNMQKLTERLIYTSVKEISVYISSIQNFRRGPEDLIPYLKSLESSFSQEIPSLAHQLNLKIVMAGDRDILPAGLRQLIEKVENESEGHQKARLNLLIAYDPWEELTEALNRCPDPSRLSHYLQVSTPVDMIIRTGGAPLLSNFLPLQSGFARFYCVDTLFNDFTVDDLQNILFAFSGLDRRFGT